MEAMACRCSGSGWVVFVTLGVAGIAGAGEPESATVRVALAWDDQTTPPCLTQTQLESAVNALLSRAAITPAPADATVRGQITSRPDGTRTARLELFRRDGVSLGVRELQSAEMGCESLREGVPLAVSLMIDTRRPEVKLQLPERSRPPIPPPNPPAVRTPIRHAHESSWIGSLDAAFSVERGLLPGTSFASRLGVSWVHASGWSLRGEGSLVAPHTEHYDEGSVTVWAWQSSAGGGLTLLDTDTFRTDALIMLESGQMVSQGVGFVTEKRARSWLLESLAGVRAAFILGRGWSLGGGAWLGVPLIRQRVTFHDAGQLGELTLSSPIFTRGELWIGLRSF